MSIRLVLGVRVTLLRGTLFHMSCKPIPENCHPFSHALAGHVPIGSRGTVIVRKNASGYPMLIMAWDGRMELPGKYHLLDFGQEECLADSTMYGPCAEPEIPHTDEELRASWRAGTATIVALVADRPDEDNFALCVYDGIGFVVEPNGNVRRTFNELLDKLPLDYWEKKKGWRHE